jgi:hypothetical protein
MKSHKAHKNAINPVKINVIPKPLKGPGTLEYRNFSRIADKATMARNHPTPEPGENSGFT